MPPPSSTPSSSRTLATPPTEVTIERDNGMFGGADFIEEVESVVIAPGDLEVFRLPRREVDGSSAFNPCATDSECSLPDRCFCSGGALPGSPGARDCRCRSESLADGMNDGSHSALTARGYRVRSQLPVIAYQFNPLDNVGVFSNDASLLLPTSALGDAYTVVGWPQTIANSSLPAEDFDSSRTDEDLRAFLTIVATAPETHVTVRMGSDVREVHGVTGPLSTFVAGDVAEFDLGAFDVINLETHGFNADFTGSVVTSNAGVAVFSGSEASDAPRFDDLANRRCCADHLEEQLFPDDVLGADFWIGRTPSRSPALNRAFLTADSVGEFDESEWVRVVAVEAGATTVSTTLPAPWDMFDIFEGENVIIEADRNFHLVTSQRVAVMQVLASQEAVGIPGDYPGGDPAIIAVPPVAQWRQDYVFLTPDLYAFDFLTIVAPRERFDPPRWRVPGSCQLRGQRSRRHLPHARRCPARLLGLWVPAVLPRRGRPAAGARRGRRPRRRLPHAPGLGARQHHHQRLGLVRQLRLRGRTEPRARELSLPARGGGALLAPHPPCIVTMPVYRACIVTMPANRFARPPCGPPRARLTRFPFRPPLGGGCAILPAHEAHDRWSPHLAAPRLPFLGAAGPRVRRGRSGSARYGRQLRRR
jgi:hypothetical protein